MSDQFPAWRRRRSIRHLARVAPSRETWAASSAPDEPMACAGRIVQRAPRPGLVAASRGGGRRARLFTRVAFVDKLDDAVEGMVEHGRAASKER